VIPAQHSRGKAGDHKFETSLGYILDPISKKEINFVCVCGTVRAPVVERPVLSLLDFLGTFVEKDLTCVVYFWILFCSTDLYVCPYNDTTLS
jgi:hypothetical protein